MPDDIVHLSLVCSEYLTFIFNILTVAPHYKLVYNFIVLSTFLIWLLFVFFIKKNKKNSVTSNIWLLRYMNYDNNIKTPFPHTDLDMFKPVEAFM